MKLATYKVFYTLYVLNLPVNLCAQVQAEDPAAAAAIVRSQNSGKTLWHVRVALV